MKLLSRFYHVSKEKENDKVSKETKTAEKKEKPSMKDIAPVVALLGKRTYRKIEKRINRRYEEQTRRGGTGKETCPGEETNPEGKCRQKTSQSYSSVG